MPLVAKKTPCRITRRIGYDAYGQEKWGERRVSQCVVISLVKRSQNTTVRADSSGTRGHADEIVSSGEILFDAKEKVLIGDRIEIPSAGMSVVVISTQPVFSVMGKVDHWRVEVEIE